MTAIRKKHLEVIPRTDEEARQKALEIYCNMQVVSINQICYRVHRPKSLINKWKDEGNWLEIRARHQREQFEQLTKNLEKEGKSAVENLKVAKELRKVLMAMAKSKLSAPEAKQLIEGLEKLQAVQEKAYSKLRG